MRTLLHVDSVSKTYHLPHRRQVVAVDRVSIDVHSGETVGIVGESGCGKSTLARLVVGLARPDAGTIEINTSAPPTGRRSARGRAHIVFQDPHASLDPRFPVGRSVSEPLVAQGTPARTIRHRVAELFDAVGLTQADQRRFPQQFSGGQRQRIAIARALAASPELVVLDEPTSALDVSVQARLLNVLLELQQRTGVAYLLISHDVAVVGHLAHRIAVMREGRIVETADAEQLLAHPRHQYTQDLLAAIPQVPGIQQWGKP